MKSTFIALLCGLLLSFISAAQCESLHVGVILPLSGDSAAIGASIRNGMLMAYDRLSPEDRAKVVLKFEDDAQQPKNTIAAYERLKSGGHADFIMTAASNTSNALAPLTESDQIPLLAIATDPKVVQGRKFAFNFWVTPEQQTKMVVPEALRRGYRRIARIATQHDGAIATKRTFDAENNGRIEIVLDEDVAGDVRDFRSYLTKLRGMKVDAVFMLLYPGQPGIFAKQARQQGVTADLFTYELFEDPGEVQASNGALVDQWYAQADHSDEFMKAYSQKYPESTAFGASNGHDALLMLAEIARRGLGKKEAAEFLETLKDFRGIALGTFSATGDHRFGLPATLKVVTKNGFERLR